jgi:hypothetical protein
VPGAAPLRREPRAEGVRRRLLRLPQVVPVHDGPHAVRRVAGDAGDAEGVHPGLVRQRHRPVPQLDTSRNPLVTATAG